MTDPDIWTFVFGIFGGIGATLMWELALKPTRARMQLAEVLSAEVSHNIQILGAELNQATASMVHSDFSLSTMVFDAVVGDLGLLPTHLIGDVVLMYRHFLELNRLRDVYGKYVDDLRNEPNDTWLTRRLKRETQQTIDVFNGSLVRTVDRVNLVQPRLLAVAFPWWSSRTWFREGSKSLDLEQMKEQTRNSEAKRQAIATALRDRDTHQNQ